MRTEPLAAADVLLALERYGPQARPYNFDDCFDCWGLVRRVVDDIDGGFEIDDELGEAGDPLEANWAAFGDPAELVPGDLLVTHPHAGPAFHTGFYCGEVAGLPLVYDSSPRGRIPLFTPAAGDWALADEREIHTRHLRATETTDRLRRDGGAYLRLWDDRLRYYHAGWRERLLAGGAPGRDLAALRRAAGLRELPFYCLRRLPADAGEREIYDNAATRRLDYYVPGAAPVADDRYGAEAAGEEPRPEAPRLERTPEWVMSEGPVAVTWEGPAVPAEGWRVEVWEETADLWRRRLLRRELEGAATSFETPGRVLRDGARHAVVVWARGPGGYSDPALAVFLYRPAGDDPLRRCAAVRPEALAPDGGAPVPPGADLDLRWRIRDAASNQASAGVVVLEDACLIDDAEPVASFEVGGPDAASCRCRVPAGMLRAGHEYRWYVTARTADGRVSVPVEGIFTVAQGGRSS